MKIRGWELQFWTFPTPFYLPCVWHFLQEHPANNHRLWVFTVPPGLRCSCVLLRSFPRGASTGSSWEAASISGQGICDLSMPLCRGECHWDECLPLRCAGYSCVSAAAPAPAGAFSSAPEPPPELWASLRSGPCPALLSSSNTFPRSVIPVSPNMETGVGIASPDILRVALSSD